MHIKLSIGLWLTLNLFNYLKVFHSFSGWKYLCKYITKLKIFFLYFSRNPFVPVPRFSKMVLAHIHYTSEYLYMYIEYTFSRILLKCLYILCHGTFFSVSRCILIYSVVSIRIPTYLPQHDLLLTSLITLYLFIAF